MVITPLRRDDVSIGMLSVTRREPGQFTPHQIELLRTFADQAVIAIENVRLFNETKEALERQTATAEILRVISSSPTDVQPVFDAIAERARVLCGCRLGVTTRFDGELLHMVGYHGVSAEAEAAMRAAFPMKLGPGSINARAVMTKGPVQIADIRLDPEYGLKTQAEEGGWRSAVAVPMLLHGQVIGAVTVCRAEPGLFPDKLVALLQTFADQAVIAIENARLFNETQEALERQTATAEILRVISGSPTDVQPVLEAIAHSSNRLLDGLSTAVFLIVDDTLHLKAFTKISDEADHLLQAAFPAPLDAYPGGAQIRAGSVAQMTDIEVDWAAHPKLLATARKRGFRSVLWTPLIRDGAAIGMISVTRVATGSFAPHHVELLRTFADQAVIAIENVRLFNETKEALEQQTATAEILRVISESPTDVQPVFDAIAERAMALCGGSMGAATRFDGELLAPRELPGYVGARRSGDACGVPDADQPRLGQRSFHPRPGSGADRRRPLGRRLPAQGGRRLGADSAVWRCRCCTRAAPSARSRAARPEPGPFPEKSIALLETFARQAVIAIENVRLFNETKEALAHQTATAEVLRVISRSQTDVQPVFGAIAAAALRLCEATSANVVTFDGTLVHVAARVSAKSRQPMRCRPSSQATPAAEPRHGQHARHPDAQRRDDPGRAAGSRLRRRGRGSGRRLPQHLGGAAAARRPGHRRHHGSPSDAGAGSRQASRPAADLRRPGGDRNRERPPVQRDARGARAADGDGRGPARHQRVGDRDAARVRRHRRARRAPDRSLHGLRVPVRRRADPYRECPRRQRGGTRRRARRISDGARRRVGHRARRARGGGRQRRRYLRRHRWRLHDPRRRQEVGLPRRAQRSDAARWRDRRRHLGDARQGRPLRRPRDRAAEDLRQPGGDRDRQRAPVQRDQGGARAADGDRQKCSTS